MASRLLKMVQSRCSPSISAAERRHASTKTLKVSPFPELDSHLAELHDSLCYKVAVIQTFFVAPDNPEIHDSAFLGAGVRIDSSLVVTSVRAVARLAAVPNSTSHKAYIGFSVARTANDPKAILMLEPAAVSFARDIAVLKVVESESESEGESKAVENLFPILPMATSPPEKESLLMALTCNSEEEEQKQRWGMISVANVRSVGKKTIKAKAPWPLDDGLGWLEHDWFAFYRGPPPPSSVLFKCEEKVTGIITKLSSSPWFNLYGEFVGLASWVVRDDSANFSVGYVAPLSNIWPVVDYAKTKGPEDRVVMDKWIDSEVIGMWPESEDIE